MTTPARIPFLILGALLATSAPAAGRHDGGLDPLAAASTPQPATAAGLTARIDPASGRLIEPDAAAMQAAGARDSGIDYSKVQVETRADGSTVVHMNGQYLSRSVARLRPDGTYDESEDAGGGIDQAFKDGSPRK
jgi:hypothetical protein